MNDFISIIIPTYNRGNCILECIANLKKQTYPNENDIASSQLLIQELERLKKQA